MDLWWYPVPLGKSSFNQMRFMKTGNLLVFHCTEKATSDNFFNTLYYPTL